VFGAARTWHENVRFLKGFEEYKDGFENNSNMFHSFFQMPDANNLIILHNKAVYDTIMPYTHSYSAVILKTLVLIFCEAMYPTMDTMDGDVPDNFLFYVLLLHRGLLLHRRVLLLPRAMASPPPAQIDAGHLLRSVAASHHPLTGLRKIRYVVKTFAC
jgi:hypothetical protein